MQFTQSLAILCHDSFKYHGHHLSDSRCSSGTDGGIFSEVQFEAQDHSLYRVREKKKK